MASYPAMVVSAPSNDRNPWLAKSNNQPTVMGKVETPKQFLQCGLFITDGSGSMEEKASGNIIKAQAVNNAILAVLLASRN